MARTKTAAKATTAKTLSEKQLETLEEIQDALVDVRRSVYDLEGQENVSTIMFQVGIVYTNIDQCIDRLDEFMEPFRSEDEDSDEDSW